MFVRHSRLMVLVAVLAVCAALPALAGKPVFHGIVSQGFLKSTDYNYLAPTTGGTFAFNEMLLNVSAPVTPNLRVGAQIMSRNLGSAGNEDVVLDWAYGDYRVRDEFGIRIGKVKTPFGLYNQTRDVDMVRNSILLPQSVYTENFRDVMNAFEGVSIYGSLALGESSSLEYDLYYGTVDVERTQFLVPNFVQPFFSQVWTTPLPLTTWSAEVPSVMGGALRWNTPFEGLRLGASVFDGELDALGNFATPYGPMNLAVGMDASPWYVVSAEYTTERLVAVFEYNRLFANLSLKDGFVPTGMPSPAPATVPMDFEFTDYRGGWYGQATWQFTDQFQGGAYYSRYYPDYTVRDSDAASAKQDDIAFTARFDVTDYWLIKAEVHLMSGTGDVQGEINAGNTSDAEDWTMFGVKSTFFF